MNRRISLMISLCFCFISLSAQPNFVFTDIAGAFGYYPLSDLGTLRQYSVTASGSHTDEWAFLVNNNFGSCGAPACAVWRHYTPGGALVPFNTSIQPNPGGNFGALYNDNTSGANQGNASFMQTTTNGNTYTFNFVENGASDSYFSILETSFNPTNLAGAVSTTTGGTITVTGLPPGLNPGEVLYCRYSTNGFVSSSILPVTVVGTTGTVQIPPATMGTVVNFYFYTTNRLPASILSDVSSYGQQAHDLSTLRILNNSGSNYTFTFGGPVIVLASTGTNTNATVYPTLKGAFDVINLAVQHTGVIQIWINGNTTETATADLTTAANFTSMTINPSGGAARSVTGNLTAALVRMNGADNVTIDGLNTNGNALTIENTQNAGAAITTVSYRNDASNHILRNCTIKGSTPTTTLGVIMIDNGAGTTGNDNITIQNNIITSSGLNLPTNGIYAGAIASVSINNNIQILNNHIFDYYNPASECGGVNLVINNQDCIISGNHIYQTAARTTSVASTVFTGIDIQNNSTDNIIITNNFIGGSGPACSGAPLTLNSSPVFRGIKCNSAAVTGTSIQGNTVSNILINTTSTSTAQAGISLVTGTFFVGNTTGNTVSNITINYNPTTASTGTIAGISTGSGTAANTNLSNNLIKGIGANTTSGRSINVYGINTLGTAGTYIVSNNQIGGPLASDSIINRTATGVIAGIRLTLNDPVMHSVSGNLVSGLQGNVGGVTAISLTGGGSSFNVTNNSVKRLKNKAIGTGNINGIFYTGTTPSVRHIFTGNTVDSLINISSSSVPITNAFNIALGGVSNFSLKNNIVKNIISINGQGYGILNSAPNVLMATNDTITGNSIRNISGINGYGLHISTTSTTETASNYIANNSFNDIRAITNALGIYKQSPAGTNTAILNNSIDSLLRTGNLITTAIWSGIYLNHSGLAQQATINGNSISNILVNSAPIYGIYLNPSGTGNFVNTTINNNILNQHVVQNIATAAALNTYGIALTGDVRGITMNQNSFRNIINGYSFVNTALNTAAVHVNCPAAFSGSVFTISQNEIFNVENTQTNGTSPISGFFINLPTSVTLSLTRNNIRAIQLQTTNTAAPIYGVYINNAAGVVENNMIRLGHSPTGASITRGYGISGISVQNGNCNFYHNSIYIGGTGVASAIPTSCFASNSTLGNVRNNIFMNTRSNLAPSAIYNHAISLANSSVMSNYNLYYTTGIDGATGFLAPSSYITLCDWKVAKVSEVNSLWGNPNFNNATGDTATVNLHIASPSAAESAGLAGLSLVDFDSDPRNASTPDLGADEANVLADIFAVNYTIGVIDSVCVGANSFSIPYVITSGSPTLYSLSNITAMAGFTSINNAAIPASPIPVNIPIAAPAGNYDFQITLFNTEYCVSKKDTLTLTIESYPVLTITDPAAVCSPITVDITDPAVTAGSTLPAGSVLSYWTNVGATSPLASPTAVSVSNTYYIKAETGAGCSDVNPVVVTINPTPILVTTDPAAVCSPATVDITTAAITAGSTLPPTTALTYWNDFAATSSLPSPSAVPASGTYFIKAETAIGCSSVDSVYVIINPSPVLVITDPAAVCSPDSVDITAPAVTAGSTLQFPNAFSYWTDFAATIGLSSPTAVVATGTYYIKAENDFGCTDTDSIHVVINSTPSLVITDPAAVCSPATVDITLAAVTVGSTIPATTAFTYWNDLAATSSLPSPSAVPASGTYFIKAETGAGCSDIDSVHVVVNATPSLVITDPAAVCDPNTIDITVPPVTAGSTLPSGSVLSYWTNAGATSTLASPSAVGASNTYYIKAETGAGCLDINPVVVTINPTPSLVITDPAAVCSPATIDITLAAVTAGSTIPATTAFTYWNDLAATSSLPSPSAVPTSGTYFIKAETGAGCSDIDSVHVVVNATPSLVITDPAAVCDPNTIDITVPAITAGSTLPSGSVLSYWTNAGATSTLASPSAVGASNTYYIKAETGAGCLDINPVVVTINPTPSLVITDPAAVCSPATVDITLAAVTAGSTIPSTTAFTYWNDLAATSSLPSPSAVPTSGTYFIKAETGTGCSDIDSVHVVVNDNSLNPPLTTSACTYLNISGSVTLTATGSGGTIEWYDNSAHTGTALGTGGSLSVSNTNTYYAFIVNASGCFTSGTPAVATIRANPSTNIPSVPGDYWATDAVPQGTWTHYCICEDDYLLLSVELNGQSIGNNLVGNIVAPGNAVDEYAVKMHLIPGNSVHIPASVPYVNTTLNPNGWWVFPRTWDVYPHSQPTTPVGIRHYYKDVDFLNLNADIVAAGNPPIPSESDLTSYKLVGYDASVKLGDMHNALTTNDILLWGNPFYYLAPWVGGTNSPSYPNVHYIQHNVASFSGGGAGGGGNGTPPLPVTLLGFDGKNEGKSNKLNWLTQNEYDMSHFEVERSKDQLVFDYIGRVESKGSAFPQNGYNFTDEHPFNNINYYRLKMVSIDGTYSYSPTIAISMNSTLSYSLYPNPAQNTLYLDLQGGQNELGLFEIFTAEGQSVVRWEGQVSEFLNLSFDVSAFAKGIYFYQIKYDKESLSGKCVIE